MVCAGGLGTARGCVSLCVFVSVCRRYAGRAACYAPPLPTDNPWCVHSARAVPAGFQLIWVQDNAFWCRHLFGVDAGKLVKAFFPSGFWSAPLCRVLAAGRHGLFSVRFLVGARLSGVGSGRAHFCFVGFLYGYSPFSVRFFVPSWCRRRRRPGSVAGGSVSPSPCVRGRHRVRRCRMVPG